MSESPEPKIDSIVIRKQELDGFIKLLWRNLNQPHSLKHGWTLDSFEATGLGAWWRRLFGLRPRRWRVEMRYAPVTQNP